jgi:hypothetical protein
MKLTILASIVVAASALPSSNSQASGLVSRGRAQVKEVRLKRRKGSKGSSKGGRCSSKGGKGRRSGSCGGHGDDYGHDIIHDDYDMIDHGPDMEYHPEPVDSGNLPSDDTEPTHNAETYKESGNLPSNEETYGMSGNFPSNEDKTYKESGTIPSSETHVPRVPAVCESGEILTVVMEGDSLDAIAQANEYNLQKLIDANPQFPDPDLIFPTDEVCVPADCKTGYIGPVDAPDVDSDDSVDDEAEEEEGSDDDVVLQDPALQQSSAIKVALSVLAAFSVFVAL